MSAAIRELLNVLLTYDNYETVSATPNFIWHFSQIIQLGAQFCLNIFIYLSSLRVSGIQVPIIRRKSLYLCDTGICHSGWVASGRPTGRHPSRVTYTSVA